MRSDGKWGWVLALAKESLILRFSRSMGDNEELASGVANAEIQCLVYCELGNSVYLTMVAGKTVSTDQRLSTVNEHEVLLEASEIFEHKKELIMSANLQTDKLLPYYKKMYQLAAGHPLDINRKF